MRSCSICLFVCYFIWYDLWVYPCGHIWQDFVLLYWLSNIPSCVCMYHIFFIYSTIGIFGCFHILAIVNSAVMNMSAHLFFKLVFLISLCYCPEVQLLDYMAFIFSNFWGTSTLFPYWLHQFTFPTHCTRFPFSPHH